MSSTWRTSPACTLEEVTKPKSESLTSRSPDFMPSSPNQFKASSTWWTMTRNSARLRLLRRHCCWGQATQCFRLAAHCSTLTSRRSIKVYCLNVFAFSRNGSSGAIMIWCLRLTDCRAFRRSLQALSSFLICIKEDWSQFGGQAGMTRRMGNRKKRWFRSKWSKRLLYLICRLRIRTKTTRL